MWSTVTLLLVAVWCLLSLPDSTQGGKRVIIKVPYIIKHVHHHHVKKVHVEKYHPPKEYHIHHKPTYSKVSKKRPSSYEEPEFEHDHEFDNYEKEHKAWSNRHEVWRKRNQNRPQKHYEEVPEGSNQVTYKTAATWKGMRESDRHRNAAWTGMREGDHYRNAAWKDVRERNPYKNDTYDERKEDDKPDTNNEQRQTQGVVPQILIAPLVPSPFALPNFNFGIHPQQSIALPLQYNPALYKTEEVGSKEQHNDESLKKPVWELTGAAWESNKPIYETPKPAFELNKPIFESIKPEWESKKPAVDVIKPDWETNKPAVDVVKPDWETNKPAVDVIKPDWESNKHAWEANNPVWEQNKPTYEVPNNWRNSLKGKKKKKPSFSYSVNVLH